MAGELLLNVLSRSPLYTRACARARSGELLLQVSNNRSGPIPNLHAPARMHTPHARTHARQHARTHAPPPFPQHIRRPASPSLPPAVAAAAPAWQGRVGIAIAPRPSPLRALDPLPAGPQVMLVQLPGLNTAVGCVPLTAAQARRPPARAPRAPSPHPPAEPESQSH